MLKKKVLLVGDGHTYERTAIEAALRLKLESPLTRKPLLSETDRMLVKNFNLDKLIGDSGARAETTAGQAGATAIETAVAVQPVQMVDSRFSFSVSNWRSGPKSPEYGPYSILLEKPGRGRPRGAPGLSYFGGLA